MKRFYGLLFVATALVSGNVFGMEEKVKMEIVKFQDNAHIMERVHAFNLIDGLDFNTLQQEFDRLVIIIQKTHNETSAYTDEDIDILLYWLYVFDETDHAYENLIATAFDLAIKGKVGLKIGMQDFERLLLVNGKNLKGVGKKSIEALQRKENESVNRNQQPLTEIEKTQRARKIVKNLTEAKNIEVDDLKLLSVDCLNSINGLVEQMIEKNKNIKNGSELLAIWKNELSSLILISDLNSQNDQQQSKEHLEQTNAGSRFKWFQAQKTIVNQRHQLRIEEQQRLGQIHQVEQEQQLQSQKSTVEELLNQHKNPNINLPNQPEQDQPDVGGGQPRQDAPKGLAVLCAAMAPKLAIMAVVVGVGYWGYTKYTAYKAAQESAAVKTMADKEKQEEAQNKQQKKQSETSRAGKRKGK